MLDGSLWVFGGYGFILAPADVTLDGSLLELNDGSLWQVSEYDR